MCCRMHDSLPGTVSGMGCSEWLPQALRVTADTQELGTVPRWSHISWGLLAHDVNWQPSSSHTVCATAHGEGRLCWGQCTPLLPHVNIQGHWAGEVCAAFKNHSGTQSPREEQLPAGGAAFFPSRVLEKLGTEQATWWKSGPHRQWVQHAHHFTESQTSLCWTGS